MGHEHIDKIKQIIYLLTTGVSAIIFLVISSLVVRPEITNDTIIAAVVLGIISLILESGITFRLIAGNTSSFSTVTYMIMIFILPFPLPAFLGALIVLLTDLKDHKAWRSLVFNPANYALTFGMTSLIWYFYSEGRSLTEISASPATFLVIIVMIAVFYVINVFLLNGFIAILNHRPISYIWLTQDRDFFLPYISLEVLGILTVILWFTVPILIPLVIVPAVTTYIAFQIIERLQYQTQEAMLAMADAIDARDPYTADHSHRLTDIAVRIAEVYGLSARETDRVELASRLHDIGKIGISNETLHKNGPLTDEEWERMKQHPVIGEQLLAPYRQFKHEAKIIRSHHERWDGAGYPDGLRGQEIPIGSRIIAVADTFDAMTSSRPYRAALSDAIAIEEIRKNAFTQFDPQIVACFLQVMEERQKIRPLTILPSTEQEERQWSSSLP